MFLFISFISTELFESLKSIESIYKENYFISSSKKKHKFDLIERTDENYKKTIINFIKSDKNKYFLKLANKKYLCVEKRRKYSFISLCDKETDPNTSWSIEEKDKEYYIKDKYGKCLSVLDPVTGGRSPLIGFDCKNKLKYKWKIWKEKDPEENEKNTNLPELIRDDISKENSLGDKIESRLPSDNPNENKPKPFNCWYCKNNGRFNNFIPLKDYLNSNKDPPYSTNLWLNLCLLGRNAQTPFVRSLCKVFQKKKGK